jgi:hypothetical protein
MEARCIDSERIAEVVNLPVDDPIRRHVDECPRCRNLLRSYLSFMDATPVEGFPIDAARRHLDALIDAKVGAGAAPGPASRFSALLRGLARPVPLLAAVAAVTVVAVVVWQQSRGPEGVNLREEPAANHMTLAPAEVRADGSVHLSWDAVPGADSYQVRVYGPGLTEIYRSADVTDTSVVVDRSALPSDLPPTLDLMWRVYALQAGDVIQTSAPGSIRTR